MTQGYIPVQCTDGLRSRAEMLDANMETQQGITKALFVATCTHHAHAAGSLLRSVN